MVRTGVFDFYYHLSSHESYRGLGNLPNHSDSDRPRCVSDRKFEIGVVGGHVFAFDHEFCDFGDTHQDVGLERLLAQGFEEWSQVLCALCLCCRGQLSWCASL